MFGRWKKPEWNPTWADEQRKDLHIKMLQAQSDLNYAAKKAIIRQGVVDLYPDGPDKERAIKDLEEAKYSLLCIIGTVDGLRHNLRNFIKENQDNFVTTKNYQIPSELINSHVLIEQAYENFFEHK